MMLFAGGCGVCWNNPSYTLQLCKADAPEWQICGMREALDNECKGHTLARGDVKGPWNVFDGGMRGKK